MLHARDHRRDRRSWPARPGEESAGREPEVDGARRERSGLQQPKAGRTLEVRKEWRAPAEDYRMDD
jgi:hypothetical protein